MEKLKLLEITFKKLSDDQAFVAYYLEQARSVENNTHEEIRHFLGCSPEEYYKLGLCKAPDLHLENFEERIGRIAGYSNTSVHNLCYLIKEGGFPQQAELSGKLFPDRDNLKNFFREIAEKIKHAIGYENALPVWFINTSLRLGQAAVSGLVIVAFILNFTTLGKGQDTVDFYKGGDTRYRNSIGGTAIQDHTFVATPSTAFLPKEYNS
jgi:hypothetical protein